MYRVCISLPTITEKTHSQNVVLFYLVPRKQDLLQDGKITVEEFKEAVQQCCVGRRYDDFPQAMKMFIDSNFKMVDLNDDGIIAADEYRFNCITKFAIDDVEVVDDAFNNLLSVSNQKCIFIFLFKRAIIRNTTRRVRGWSSKNTYRKP